ncbi:MAG: DUF3341 domain-containing protein [Candidatus Sumerlaeia bacterium]
MIATRTWGLLAEFGSPEALLEAIRRARGDGYVRVNAYTPFPVDGLSEALGRRPTRLPFLVLAGGLLGGIGGYLMQYYSAVWDYPINVGGRPLHSWPSFIPITFELTVLLSALTGLVAMVILNRLPQPYHPLFNAEVFKRATSDRFFMAIGAEDERFHAESTRAFMESLGALSVTEIFDESVRIGVST